MEAPTKLPRTIRSAARAGAGAADGLLRLWARARFQRCGLFAALPLTGHVLAVEGDRGYLAEAAVHHIPNRRCTVSDSGRRRRPAPDRRVRRRKFHRVCAAPDRLPFADGSLDAAWTTVPRPRTGSARQAAALREMARVVRPGGTLVLIATLGGDAEAMLERAGWGLLRVEASGLCRTFVARRG